MNERETWGHEETTTSKTPQRGVLKPVSLRVVIDDLVTSHALPERGEISIGRAPDVHVRISVGDVSRHHAILHVDKHIGLRDLGSANGTFWRGKRLQKGRWQAIERGDCFFLADVAVIVNDGPIQRRPRRSVGKHAFAEELEAQLGKYHSLGKGFAVCHVRCVSTRRWVDVLEAMLMPKDHFSVLDDSQVAAILVGRTEEQYEAVEQALLQHLRRIGARPEIRMTLCPKGGSTTRELFPEAGEARERTKNPTTLRPPKMVVQNPAMERLYELVDEVAPSPASILILGETGVGKEVLARAIHDRSGRKRKPFLALNCAALSENLLESELFGYEKGAFTGAVTSKAGLLETAQGGTVFLDELGDMPLSTQAKLLRVLEERKVWRLGDLKPRAIDVRIVAATNHDLEQAIAEGEFRADLFYRLNGLSLTIPPLRERRDEIRPLAERFADSAADALKKPRPVLSLEAIEALTRHDWPGNIRELKNVIERAVLLSRGGLVGLDELPDDIREPPPAPPRVSSSTRDTLDRITLDRIVLFDLDGEEDEGPPITQRPNFVRPPAPRKDGVDESAGAANLQEEMERLEKARIVDALKACHGNQTRAATMLGITRRMLISRIERYGIPRPRKK